MALDFDCNQFSSLRSKYPHFSTVLRSIRENSTQQNFSIDTDLQDLFRSIQDGSKCGFSLATFIRHATIDGKTWLSNVCVRGRPCVPPSHWNRNIFFQPVVEAEFPADVSQELDCPDALLLNLSSRIRPFELAPSIKVHCRI